MMNDAMNHLRAEINTEHADHPDAKAVTHNSERQHEADQGSPPPSALQKQIAGQETGDEQHPTRSDSAALLGYLNRNVR